MATINKDHPKVRTRDFLWVGLFKTAFTCCEVICWSPTSMLCCTFSLIIFSAGSVINEFNLIWMGSNTISSDEKLNIPKPFHWKGSFWILAFKFSPNENRSCLSFSFSSWTKPAKKLNWCSGTASCFRYFVVKKGAEHIFSPILSCGGCWIISKLPICGIQTLLYWSKYFVSNENTLVLLSERKYDTA